MSAPEAPAKPAQDHPSLWQRSLWPLVLSVALPLFVLALIVEHWLPLEGRLALMVKLGMAGAIGVTVGLIIEKSRKLMRQRREAEVAAGGSGS
ncbi:MAG: hypothetical protein OXH86_06850 [Acidimicrobiaceae bacterium]|nr:hypothetical protein [Acidimicrobiaceae bacterium]MDE0497052.1 hypothetical protein [Acidimicrobiaceae bacterium]